MNLDFSLPSSIDNWELRFFGKFEKEKLGGLGYGITTQELIMFIANNAKALSDKAVISFLDKTENNFGVFKESVLQNVRIYKERLTELANANSPQEDEQQKESSFVKVIRKMKEVYTSLSVNALTKELLNYKEKEENPYVISHQTLFTRLKFDGYKFSKSDILDYLYSPDYTNHINPITQIAQQFPKWEPGDYDFVSGVFEFVKIKSENPEHINFYKSVFLKWAIKSIENTIDDTALPNKQIIIFQGGTQSRKTSFIRSLIRPFAPYTKEEIEIKMSEINTKKALTQNIFILNDEFDKMNLKELKEFKVMTAADEIKYKPVGSQFEQNFKKRANMISSTNPDRFLTDMTGNVRFIIIPIANTYKTPIASAFLDDAEYFRAFWGQIFYYYKQTKKNLFNAELTTEELTLQEVLNRNHTTYKDLEIAILMLYPQPEHNEEKYTLSAGELLEKIKLNTAIPLQYKSGLNEISLGKKLTALGYNRVSTHTEINQKYRYEFKK